MARKIIFLDIDNTLYPWGTFFAPSFRAMVHALSRELSMDEDKLYEEFKDVYGQHKSLEYAFAIQELDSVRMLEADRIKDLVKCGRGAFLRVQRLRLQPYPGVMETLNWLNEQGHVLVGITNSPMFLAQKRLYTLKIDQFLDGLVAWEGFAGDSDSANDGFVPGRRTRRATRLKRVMTLSLDECKPNSRHYGIALEEFGFSSDDAFAIGDSLFKDLAPAATLGIKTIWARYGSGLNSESRDDETLLRITHWNKAKIENVYSAISPIEPTWVIDSFAEVRSLVPTNTASLF